MCVCVCACVRGRGGALLSLIGMFTNLLNANRSVDDLLENTAKNISDKYKDTMIAAPSFNTIKLTNRQLKGFDYSYTSGGGKAMTALNYAEDVGGYFFVWTASYYADDSATPAAMQIAADTLQSLS